MPSIEMHETFKIIEPYLKSLGLKFGSSRSLCLCTIPADQRHRHAVVFSGMGIGGGDSHYRIIEVEEAIITVERSKKKFDLHEPDALEKLTKHLLECLDLCMRP